MRNRNVSDTNIMAKSVDSFENFLPARTTEKEETRMYILFFLIALRWSVLKRADNHFSVKI